MENFLITQGCTGTYSIINVIGKCFNYGCNPSINHHCRNPNYNIFSDNSKVAYLMCNPYDYIVSAFARNEIPPHTFNISLAEKCGGNPKYFQERTNQTLEEYLKDPYDALDSRGHAEGFLNNKDRKYNLLFMRYEALEDYGIEPLIDFWNLDINPKIYKFKKRKTDWTQMSEEIKNLLSKKYGKNMEWYQNLPLIQKFEV